MEYKNRPWSRKSNKDFTEAFNTTNVIPAIKAYAYYTGRSNAKPKKAVLTAGKGGRD